MSCGCNDKYGCAFDPNDEGPSEADIARFGTDDIPCPSCGTSVYHDAPLCQSCGHAITATEASGGSRAGKQLLIGTVGVVTITAFVLITVM